MYLVADYEIVLRAEQASCPDSGPALQLSGSRFAMVGSPNSGKTTLFSALTGLRAKTGNYPGVTVFHYEGTVHLADALTITADATTLQRSPRRCRSHWESPSSWSRPETRGKWIVSPPCWRIPGAGQCRPCCLRWNFSKESTYELL